MAAPMWMFWVEHGPVADGRRAVEALLRLPSAAPRDGLRKEGLAALGALNYWEADYASSERAYGEAMEISQQLGDIPGSAEAMKNLAYVAGAAGDAARARTLATEVRKIATSAGLRMLAAEASGLVGLARSREGDHEGALEATQEALEGFEAEGVVYWANEMKSRLGSIYLRMGRLDEGEAYLRSALGESRALSGAVGIGATTILLAAAAAARGEHERALRLMGFAEAVAARTGNSPPTSLLGETGAFLEASRLALDRDTVELFLAEGKAMDEQDAIAYALGESP
jgi:tetratricopeptide (TPR) repeat protein